MKKKKMKLWKKILIVLIIILLIFIIITLKKTIILSNIDSKVSELENNKKEIYSEVLVSSNTHTSKMERYIKGNVEKLVLENIDKNGEKTKIIQITYPKQRKVFIEKDNTKVLNIYDEVSSIRGSHIEDSNTTSYSAIINFGYSINIYEQILNSILTSIKNIEIDGKQCYELSSLHNSNFIYSQNKKEMKAYIEKDTGLPIKLVEVINEDGQEIENITTYQYKFDTVTNEEIQEPNNQEYKIQE